MFHGPDNFTAGTGWTNITPFPQPTFGDDSSMLLNNGLILLGTGAAQGFPYTGNALTYLYNPTSHAITTMVNGASQSIAPGSYSTGIPGYYGISSSEQGWVKLPDGDVLTYDVFLNDVFNYNFGTDFGGYAELFNPSIGEWRVQP